MSIGFHPCPKPAPRVKARKPQGPTSRRRAQKARTVTQAKRSIKSHVKALDGYRCRWPGCDVPPTSFWGELEAAHYRAEGMGGDPTLIRTTPEGLLLLCKWHHQGPFGLHSGLARMRPLTDQGMRGPVEFSAMDTARRWKVVGISEPPTVIEEA